MKSKAIKAFVSASVASCFLATAALGYCAATKWARHASFNCDVDGDFYCPWVTTATFDAGEVNSVIVDTYNHSSGAAYVTAFICYEYHSGAGVNCSSGFSSNAQSGATPIVINDSIAGGTTALDYWRNHAADYPFIDVRINNADGQFQGYKVTN